jgi:hypothetical protein
MEKNILSENMRRFYTKNLNEQTENFQIFDKNYFKSKKSGTISFDNNERATMVDGIEINKKYYDNQWHYNFMIRDLDDIDAGDYDWTYSDEVPFPASEKNLGISIEDEGRPGIMITDNSQFIQPEDMTFKGALYFS